MSPTSTIGHDSCASAEKSNGKPGQEPEEEPEEEPKEDAKETIDKKPDSKPHSQLADVPNASGGTAQILPSQARPVHSAPNRRFLSRPTKSDFYSNDPARYRPNSRYWGGKYPSNGAAFRERTGNWRNWRNGGTDPPIPRTEAVGDLLANPGINVANLDEGWFRRQNPSNIVALPVTPVSARTRNPNHHTSSPLSLPTNSDTGRSDRPTSLDPNSGISRILHPVPHRRTGRAPILISSPDPFEQFAEAYLALSRNSSPAPDPSSHHPFQSSISGSSQNTVSHGHPIADFRDSWPVNSEFTKETMEQEAKVPRSDARGGPFQSSAPAPSFQTQERNTGNHDEKPWQILLNVPRGPRLVRPPPGFTGPGYSQQPRLLYPTAVGDPRGGDFGDFTYVENPSHNSTYIDGVPAPVPAAGATPGKPRSSGVAYPQRYEPQQRRSALAGAERKYVGEAKWTNSQTWTSSQENMRREYDHLRSRARHLSIINSPAFPKTAFEYAELKSRTKQDNADDMNVRIHNLEEERAGKMLAACHDLTNSVSRQKAAELTSPADGLSMVFGQKSAFAQTANAAIMVKTSGDADKTNSCAQKTNGDVDKTNGLANKKTGLTNKTDGTNDKPTGFDGAHQPAETSPQSQNDMSTAMQSPGAKTGPYVPEQSGWPTIAELKAFGDANARAGAPRRLPPPRATAAGPWGLTSLEPTTLSNQQTSLPQIDISELPGAMVDLLEYIL